jgi:hypothetical protein
VKSIPFELCDKFARLKIVVNTEAMEMELGSTLLLDIWRGQLEDEKIQVQNIISRKRNSLDLRKMIKEYYGTKEGSVCLTSRRWRIRYFERLTNPIILSIQERIRCTMISRPLIGME